MEKEAVKADVKNYEDIDLMEADDHEWNVEYNIMRAENYDWSVEKVEVQ